MRGVSKAAYIEVFVLLNIFAQHTSPFITSFRKWKMENMELRLFLEI